MKVFALTFVVLLLAATFAHAAKNRRAGEKRAAAAAKVSEAEEAPPKLLSTETVTTDKKEKEVHKRGILHYGGGLAGAASLWPKTYASHYGYGLPAAAGFATHLHASPALKYHGQGFHYKAVASPNVLPAVASLSSAWPNYAGLSPAVAHAQPVAAPAQPFIIRPGGAVVQSYSVTYPQRKPAAAVRPIHSFAALTPVHHAPAVATVPAVQPAVAAIQPLHSYQTVQAVQHAVQPVQPVHHLTPVQTVQHLPPIAAPPVQTVVQTSFIPPASALPQAPVVAFNPAQAAFPIIPTFPNPPDFPTIPSIPVIPSQPSVPDVPAVPAIPSIPSIPTIPSIPNFPQPQVPSSSFFPVSVQPPLNQNPPTFGSVNPPNQFAGFGPIAGGSRPDFGSADAAPQIPVQAPGSPELQLPAPQPEATQTPWKPVLYEPPTAESPVGRPSHTLLPPYGSSPAEGYLPPAAAASHSDRIQPEYTIDSSLFDNLSDADIQQIFAQASLAAHRDHHHHTVHNYHTRY